MQNASIARQFFEQHLPQSLFMAIDPDSIELEDCTYIDKTMQETFSDLVFSCKYNKNTGGNEAKVTLLVEHQSTPDKFMAFRVYHYMFNMLYKELKKRKEQQSKAKLPAVYALVFYHGKQTPYPYSLRLPDCFDDPLKIMDQIFAAPVPLIDVNQVKDDELKRQQLLGIMTGALKYSRDRDIGSYLEWLSENMDSVDLSQHLTLDFFITMLNYLLKNGNVIDVKQLIKVGQQMPEPVRGEFMTAAEKLRAWGEETGIEKGRKEVAISLLKDGAEPKFAARITKIELTEKLKLQAQLDEE